MGPYTNTPFDKFNQMQGNFTMLGAELESLKKKSASGEQPIKRKTAQKTRGDVPMSTDVDVGLTSTLPSTSHAATNQPVQHNLNHGEHKSFGDVYDSREVQTKLKRTPIQLGKMPADKTEQIYDELSKRFGETFEWSQTRNSLWDASIAKRLNLSMLDTLPTT